MTIKELYEWAKLFEVENLPLRISRYVGDDWYDFDEELDSVYLTKNEKNVTIDCYN